LRFALVYKNGNVVKNSWCFFEFNCVKCGRQSKEEAGSAGEQPASNKVDGYTIVTGVSNGSFTFTIGILYG
jgi:hypothetical protein